MNAELSEKPPRHGTMLARLEDIIRVNCDFILLDLHDPFKDVLDPESLDQFAIMFNCDVVRLTEHVCYVISQLYWESVYAVKDTTRTVSEEIRAVIKNAEIEELPKPDTIEGLNINPQLYSFAIQYLKRNRPT